MTTPALAAAPAAAAPLTAPGGERADLDDGVFAGLLAGATGTAVPASPLPCEPSLAGAPGAGLLADALLGEEPAPVLPDGSLLAAQVLGLVPPQLSRTEVPSTAGGAAAGPLTAVPAAAPAVPADAATTPLPGGPTVPVPVPVPVAGEPQAATPSAPVPVSGSAAAAASEDAAAAAPAAAAAVQPPSGLLVAEPADAAAVPAAVDLDAAASRAAAAAAATTGQAATAAPPGVEQPAAGRPDAAQPAAVQPDAAVPPELVVQPAPGAVTTAAVDGSSRVDALAETAAATGPEQVRPAVAELARGLRDVGGGRASLVVRLDPPELGPVLVRLTVVDGRVDVQLRTAEAVAAVGLGTASADVRSMLLEHGLDLSSFDVSTGDLPGDSSLAQRDASSDQGTPRRDQGADRTGSASGAGGPAGAVLDDSSADGAPAGTWL